MNLERSLKKRSEFHLHAAWDSRLAILEHNCDLPSVDGFQTAYPPTKSINPRFVSTELRSDLELHGFARQRTPHPAFIDAPKVLVDQAAIFRAPLSAVGRDGTRD